MSAKAPRPPTVVLVVFEGWPAIYAEAVESLAVLPTVDPAVAWTYGLIARIEGALAEERRRPADAVLRDLSDGG